MILKKYLQEAVMAEFKHTHAAHCESGVMSSMLRHHGLDLSEAMVFGLSGAMVFAYLPFIKMGGMPLIAYRMMPKAIIKGLQKNIGIKMSMQTFSKPQQGMEALDALLDKGKIVGAQTSVFWLPYFPDEMRFHFNAHNLIVYDRNESRYKISDPVFEHTVESDMEGLKKARFAKGIMAPKGLLYYPEFVPESVDFETVIPKTIKKTAKMMLKTPVPIVGIKGIRYLAKHIRRLENRDRRYARLFLGHIVRMQEEIGTGGAGFRYVYASYLEEASAILKNSALFDASKMMTETGDLWRDFALMVAKAIRSKKSEPIEYDLLAEKLDEVAESESIVYRALLEAF
jgi:hypothetical protein